MITVPAGLPGPATERQQSPADRNLDDRVPFLARLEREDRSTLLSLGRRISYPARSVVMRQEEPSDHIILILQGWMKVTAAAANGYEALLALRGPGDIVGESAALTGRPRAATVTALELVDAVAIDRQHFTDYLQQKPNVALQLLALGTDRLRAADRRRLDFAALTVRQRLCGLLLELARSHGNPTDEGIMISVPLSQQELAGSVGASREAVARLLKELRERGAVITRRRCLVIARPDVLSRIH
ncbi:CRP/FNR family cyclic AMP-dependent transcriptional regulator [Kitasatospora sp. MAP12-15]|uniref:Crp/Fnr family transcriptional regulator n=1 Tax=unclassified Kitasatospora TaxID=2633591 RepID=UPI00247608FC|nr:Crp/Fnr family transcriptional regulator [Kitasatospora sp. MAP12-44]MDH6109704.1 CRP/FNR family cyclic AMP-dependent transcriptional regulator [Kitasatospora sp. MAP12-44]